MAKRGERKPPKPVLPAELADARGEPYARLLPGATDCADETVEIHAEAAPLIFTRRGAATLGELLMAWAADNPDPASDRGRRLYRLLGAAEVCELAKCAPETLRAWRERHDFPKPVEVLDATPVWRSDVVRYWLRRHRPKRGRPRKRITETPARCDRCGAILPKPEPGKTMIPCGKCRKRHPRYKSRK